MKIVNCDVSRQVIRADLQVGDTIYKGAGVHGSGGLLRWKRSAPIDQVKRELEHRARRGAQALIWTTYRAVESESIYLDPSAIVVLSAEPAEE